MNKIFCIGLSKTGTKSLDNAFRILGVPTWHYPPPGDFRARKPEIMCATAFSDINVTYEYKKLDEEYPNSKFIYTVRDTESWLESCKNAFGGEKESYMRNRYANNGISKEIHHHFYGDWGFEKNKFIKAFNDHSKDVHDYFYDRPDDLLIMAICNGDGWEVLCPFLGLDIPNEEFPHSGKRKT